jgi:hypothetical protein
MPAGDSLWRYLLILAVLGNCLPCFAPEDANRDRRVDLSDAVVQVRSLVEAAQNQEAGRIDIQKAILAVNATAGLETVIQSEMDPSFDRGRISSVGPWLSSSFFLSHPAVFSSIIFNPPVRFDSLNVGPVSPPPELA